MRLYIIRHGETMWNALGRIQGSTDIELNENGINLAKKTGEALMDVDFDLVISSPLKRALDTAKYALNGREIPIIIDKRIQEICFGIMEGTEVKGPFANEFRAFFKGEDLLATPENGESLQDILDRTKIFWDELIHREDLQDATIMIASHGCAVRAILQNIYQDGDFWHGKVPPNCSLNIVDVQDGQAAFVAEDLVLAEI